MGSNESTVIETLTLKNLLGQRGPESLNKLKLLVSVKTLNSSAIIKLVLVTSV